MRETERCPRCKRKFEVVMFHGIYETDCCGIELKADPETQKAIDDALGEND